MRCWQRVDHSRLSDGFAQGQRIGVTGFSTENWTHQSVCLWLPKTTEIVWVLHLDHLDPAQKSEIWQKGVPRGHDVFWILLGKL